MEEVAPGSDGETSGEGSKWWEQRHRGVLPREAGTLAGSTSGREKRGCESSSGVRTPSRAGRTVSITVRRPWASSSGGFRGRLWEDRWLPHSEAGGGERCEQSNSGQAQEAGEAEFPGRVFTPSPVPPGGVRPDPSRAHPHASRMRLSFSEVSKGRQELLSHARVLSRERLWQGLEIFLVVTTREEASGGRGLWMPQNIQQGAGRLPEQSCGRPQMPGVPRWGSPGLSKDTTS